jgi:hypothetical protein
MANFDPNVTAIVEGVAAGKVVQSLVRKFGDLAVAPLLLYTPEQYVKDLKTAGYVVQAVDAAKTDAEIGTIVMQTSGYTFLSGPANLRGSAKLTADPFTYQAAAGQKVPAYMFPSTWFTGIIGIAGVADGYYNFTGMAKHKLLIAAAGASMLGDGITRGIGVDGTISAPSGFDVSKQPAMQQLDHSAMQNLQRLSAENNNLRNELMQLRAAGQQQQQQVVQAQPPRGMPSGIPSYTVNATQPVVQVTEIIPSKGAEAIKQRTHLVGGAIQKATPESVKHQTGLVTLTGGR